MFFCEEMPPAANDNKPSCLRCGAEFIPFRGKKYCTRKCKKLASAARNGRHTTAPERACERCGDAFNRRPNTKDAARFCSRECAGVGPMPDHVVGNVVCLSAKPRPCAQCGVSFRPVNNNNNAKFCGSACADDNAIGVAHGVRRARMMGADNDNVDPIAVFERDGWKCKMCGVDTPRYLRGTDHAQAPEMDHIVPLSRGGSHTYDNVQCSCLRCNRSKGTKSLELFMETA